MITDSFIKIVKSNKYNCVAHCIDCFNSYDCALSQDMAENFITNQFALESPSQKGKNKVGQIDVMTWLPKGKNPVKIFNFYTYFNPRKKKGKFEIEAFVFCLKTFTNRYPDLSLAIGFNKGDVDLNKIEKILENFKNISIYEELERQSKPVVKKHTRTIGGSRERIPRAAQ